MTRRYIDPINELGTSLLEAEKPARYLGGEYGRLAKKDAPFQTVIAFPDLYEIGMSNQALRIIYNRLNSMDGISCDRAFSPAPDFEVLLRKKKLPLYGLDTGIALKDAELLLFTLSYELNITDVLAMLDLAGIRIHTTERGEDDPVVIMGGPAVSNPLPFSAFIDCFWIGEAEAGFFELVDSAHLLKQNNASRKEIVSLLTAHPSVWAQGKTEAKRAVDWGFSFRPPMPAVFPVPSMKVVQHHGAVEIMRGCPNGCRFCHAGYWYRPMRQKSAETVMTETAAFINEGGYREISLSSLSTGDYESIDNLVESLNRKYNRLHISFQLPSLKVSSFSLPLLEKVSEVRKSGLTFAVETPDDFWQLALNKKASLDSVTAIIREAKKNGWRGVKFYFMIGLPLGCKDEQEDEKIVDFILEAACETGMHFNINIGTFIPKPHTPFQWAAQLHIEEAEKRLYNIRDRLKPKGHKVGIQDTLISTIEGIICRGDERAGGLIEEAWRMGARLDSWREYFKREIWNEILEAHKNEAFAFLESRPEDQILPWAVIKPGVSDNYIKNELRKSESREITLPCTDKCNFCGICNKEGRVVTNFIQDEKLLDKKKPFVIQVQGSTTLLLFTFSKNGIGIFYPHLTLMEIFGMAFLRAGIPAGFSEGFNPLPRLEIVSPLAMGVSSSGETALIEVSEHIDATDFMEKMNKSLPQGLMVLETLIVQIPPGKKKYSLSALLYGAAYQNENGVYDIVRFKDEKNYRLSLTGGSIQNLSRLKRNAVLAFHPENPDVPLPYFDVFRKIYP
jgi:radical SAM superfamily enzyme YgiQ (UPF0313 family)